MTTGLPEMIEAIRSEYPNYKEIQLLCDALTLAIDQTNVAIDGLEELSHSSYGEMRQENCYELLKISEGEQ